MRKIEIGKWTAKDKNGKEIEETLLNVLNVIIAGQKPENIPRGVDKFRIMNRLAKAFDKAEDAGFLVLEEGDYKFVKDMMDKDLPAIWGFNPDISAAIERFLNAERE